ncbi:MAG: hypothetical protein QOI03_656 [Solirubrobacteraceae bacterium]|jgi:hypothetical protein|nr:hypothetical protein [Solirubrobacteraceae bacterium]
MRIAIASTTAAAAAFAASAILGVASAEAPTSTSLRTVSVQGVASAPISQQANLGEANAAYRQAMTAAVADGKSKAESLATAAAATLGAVQNIAEGGGYVNCPAGEGETEGNGYQGIQPDFGAGVAIPGVRAGAAVPLRAPARTHRRRKHVVAKKAAGVSCVVYAQVGLSYLIA